MVAYAAWLVHRGLFERVCLSYLVAGHTKFAPDRFFFGTLARMTFIRNGYTIFDLEQEANSISNVTATVLKPDQFMDYRNFFESDFHSNNPRDQQTAPHHSLQREKDSRKETFRIMAKVEGVRQGPMEDHSQTGLAFPQRQSNHREALQICPEFNPLLHQFVHAACCRIHPRSTRTRSVQGAHPRVVVRAGSRQTTVFERLGSKSNEQ